MACLHISCPYTSELKDIVDLANRLRHSGHQITYWQRDATFDLKWLKDADGIVFMLPNNAWDIQAADLPKGMRWELDHALKEGQDLFIQYVTRAGEKRIYKADWYPNILKLTGITGTYDCMTFYRPDKNACKKVPIKSDCVKYGGRVHPLDDDTDYFPPIEVRPDIIHGYAYKQIPVILLRRRH